MGVLTEAHAKKRRGGITPGRLEAHGADCTVTSIKAYRLYLVYNSIKFDSWYRHMASAAKTKALPPSECLVR